MEDSLAESFDGDEQEAAAVDAPAAPAHCPAIQISRRFSISVHMVWGLTCLLMLRAIPSFVMQTPDLKGMGDPGQILDRPFTNVEKATILAAWGWGYCGCQMPGGALSQRIGGKRTWLMAFMLSAITSFSIPTVGAVGGVYAIAAFNFLSGCGQAPLFPAMSGLQGAWIPQREWARASSLVGCMWSGGQMITKLAAPWVLMNWGWGCAHTPPSRVPLPLPLRCPSLHECTRGCIARRVLPRLRDQHLHLGFLLEQVRLLHARRRPALHTGREGLHQCRPPAAEGEAALRPRCLVRESAALLRGFAEVSRRKLFAQQLGGL